MTPHHYAFRALTGRNDESDDSEKADLAAKGKPGEADESSEEDRSGYGTPAFAAKRSAQAFQASSTAHKSGEKDDHAKAADKHALAFSANMAAGNKPEAKQHQDLMGEHHADCMK